MSAYVDGELDAPTAAAVAPHLRECWVCSGDVELFRMVKRSLRSLAHDGADALSATRLRRFASSLKH